MNVQHEEFDDEVEPSVPPGLKKLTAPLKALADFLHIEESLIRVAAARSGPAINQRTSERALQKWIRGLPIHEKDSALTRILSGEASMVRLELLNRFRKSEMARCPLKRVASRTAVQLHKEWARRS
ncbi:MAG: hypothetical protein IPK83_17175 [Planctomycetes bacterium]|nr:hypothetical protein [Planctomycetota bacterium]